MFWGAAGRERHRAYQRDRRPPWRPPGDSGQYGRARSRRVPGRRGRDMAADANTQITELRSGDHACLTFAEAEELFDLTAAYVRDGLAGGLKVIWLSDEGRGVAVAELARRGIAVQPAIEAGQMAAEQCEGRLLTGQVF